MILVMKLRPEHFDWLGLVVFPFILGCGAYALMTGNALPAGILWMLVLIGFGGILVDGYVIYNYFVKKKDR